MTQAPTAEHFIELEVTAEEHDAFTAKAQSVGLDLDTYVKLRVLSGGELPEPAAFFELFRRQALFAKDYEALIKSYAAGETENMAQIDALTETFAGLLQDWDEQYGPR